MASIIPFLGPIISGASSALGGMFGRQKNQETKIQKKQRELVDQLIGSLNGQGPYANLFTANPEDFERSFAAPARARFRNQTAPQIQQSYIADGQQRSTGLEDTLARAGVDMEQLLNQHYLDYQQGAQNRSANAIGQILGQGAGAANPQSWQSAAGQGFGGYISGPSFGRDLEGILSSFSNRKIGPEQSNSLTDTYRPPSKGFEQERQTYNPYTGVMQ